jgi:hypothetical protein
MRIREFSPQDLDQVTRVWARSGPPGTGFETGELIAWLGELNLGLCLVAEVRETIVAAVAATYDGSAGCVHHMAVGGQPAFDFRSSTRRAKGRSLPDRAD